MPPHWPDPPPVLVLPGGAAGPPARPPPAANASACAALSACFTCLRNELCGWCADDNVCIPGDVWGPTTAAQCGSKWEYMSSQCYFTQGVLMVGTFATLVFLVLAIAGCTLCTVYRLKRQRLVAREYVRLFSEYSAYQSASLAAAARQQYLQGHGQPPQGLPPLPDQALGAPPLGGHGAGAGSNGYYNYNSSVRGLVHSRSQGSGIGRPYYVGEDAPATPQVPAWYGSLRDDEDADTEPWERAPVRRNDSGVLAADGRGGGSGSGGAAAHGKRASLWEQFRRRDG